MRPLGVVALVVVAVLAGFGSAYFWQSQDCTKEVAALQAELGDVKSKMGTEVQSLRNEMQKLTATLADAERRLQDAEAERKVMEETLKKTRRLK